MLHFGKNDARVNIITAQRIKSNKNKDIFRLQTDIVCQKDYTQDH